MIFFPSPRFRLKSYSRLRFIAAPQPPAAHEVVQTPRLVRVRAPLTPALQVSASLQQVKVAVAGQGALHELIEFAARKMHLISHLLQ